VVRTVTTLPERLRAKIKKKYDWTNAQTNRGSGNNERKIKINTVHKIQNTINIK